MLGSVSRGRMVLLKNSAMLLMLIAASMLVSSVLKMYPMIMPRRVKSVVNKNTIRSVGGRRWRRFFPKK